MEKKQNNLRLIIGIGAIASLMSFAFICGLVYGSFQSTIGFANYMNEYEDELLQEFRQTCDYDFKTQQLVELETYSIWLEKGHINREDLTYN